MLVESGSGHVLMHEKAHIKLGHARDVFFFVNDKRVSLDEIGSEVKFVLEEVEFPIVTIQSEPDDKFQEFNGALFIIDMYAMRADVEYSATEADSHSK